MRSDGHLINNIPPIDNNNNKNVLQKIQPKTPQKTYKGSYYYKPFWKYTFIVCQFLWSRIDPAREIWPAVILAGRLNDKLVLTTGLSAMH